MMDSTYSVSSLHGLVSSKRRLHFPPNSLANPKLRLIDLAWPICRYPFGSGGKRVCTRPPYLLVFRSSRIMSRMKWLGAASLALFSTGSGFVLIYFSTRGHAGDSADSLLDSFQGLFP